MSSAAIIHDERLRYLLKIINPMMRAIARLMDVKVASMRVAWRLFFFFIFETQTQFHVQYGRKSIFRSCNNSADDFSLAVDDAFVDWKTFYMFLRPYHFILIFHLSSTHATTTTTTITTIIVKDLSPLITCSITRGFARHSRGQSHSLAFVSPSILSLSSRNALLSSSSRTISRERSRINPISSLERSFPPRCLMTAFLIINFPSLAEEIAERREISLP